VIIVPVTNSGQMILIDQYRYSIDQWCLEVKDGQCALAILLCEPLLRERGYVGPN